MPATDDTRWSLPQRIAVRFAILYFGLFFVLDGLNRPLANLAAPLWHVPTPLLDEATGSGDRPIDWLATVGKLVLALLGTSAWTLFDRKLRPPDTTYEVLRVMLRYVLGFTLLGYGFGKTAQFPPPGLLEYGQPLGATTPMGLLWTFMGYSVPYGLFTGVLEVVGAFLLFFRRTTTLGATLYAAVMLNVFVLNLCYDVPVKLFSFHLLLAALVLILPDARRLLDVFVSNRPTQPRVLTPPVRYRKLRIGVLVAKWALVSLALCLNAANALQGWRKTHIEAGRLSGVWTVASFRSAKEEPWEWAILDQWPKGGAVEVHLQSGAPRRSRLQVEGTTLSETGPNGNRRRAWRYRLDGERLVLESLPGYPESRVELRRDEKRLPLMRHGFHWVQEHPRTP